MLFNSFAFAIFLPLVFLLYWILPHRFRWIFLLAASFYFYMSLDVKYLFLLLFTTILSYSLARMMEYISSKRKRKLLMAAGAVLLLFILFLFKYLAFFFEIVNAVTGRFSIPMSIPAIQLMLPVGISFYTFQTLGYLIDVYREKYPAEKHFGYYCLFASFFPQLLSGPIGRGDSLLPQYKEKQVFDPKRASYGLKLMAVGYFKKLVVAGSLISTVDSVFDQSGSYVGLVFLIATFMFAIQIYCDFSGYSDIAIGTAMLFGITLPDNFRSPYFSRSIKEFWSRWHISLSTWFRDYVYIPLGGNRVGVFRQNLNLMITFLVSGLWHGAGITYLIWGGLHGFYQIVENLIFRHNGSFADPASHNRKRRSILFMPFTFLAVCFAWIFFRAPTLADAWRVISYIPFDIKRPDAYFQTAVISLNLGLESLVFILLPLLLLFIYDLASLKTDVLVWIGQRKAYIRYPVYIIFLLIILLFSEKGVSTEFYYFQF